MHKRYTIALTSSQRTTLEECSQAGAAPARTQTHARILLKADTADGGPGWTDAAIVAALDVSRPTVERVRRAFVTHGIAAALHRRRPSGPPRRKLDGRAEAQLIAVTCSNPPPGHERWTLTMLADRLVELKVVDAIAPETVRSVLKKTNSSRG